MARLDGKVTLITGAGAGIGRAAALLFAKEGAKVVVADFNEAGAQETVRQVASAGGEAESVNCDVGHVDSVRNAIAYGVDRFGALHVIYNNAGGSGAMDSRVTDAPEEEFWRTIRVNLFGTFLTCKYGIPHLIAAGGGSIMQFEKYKAANIDLFLRYGAHFLIRGGAQTLVEGSARGRNVVIEFPSYQTALECWRSPEYAKSAALRRPFSSADIVIVEGVP